MLSRNPHLSFENHGSSSLLHESIAAALPEKVASTVIMPRGLIARQISGISRSRQPHSRFLTVESSQRKPPLDFISKYPTVRSRFSGHKPGDEHEGPISDAEWEIRVGQHFILASRLQSLTQLARKRWIRGLRPSHIHPNRYPPGFLQNRPSHPVRRKHLDVSICFCRSRSSFARSDLRAKYSI